MYHMFSRPDSSKKHDLSFSILRIPFFLEPDYPEDVVSVGTNRERLIKKWGGKQGWEDQKRRHDLKGRGQAAGIPHFNLDRLTGNTLASHRLIQHVGKLYGLNISEGLYDKLNTYYFVDGHSLNDRPRLAKVAAEQLELLLSKQKINHTVMTETDIFDFLESDKGRDEIMKALGMLRHMGIHSIPKFIIEGTTLVDGAADWRVFVEIFTEIEERGMVQNGGKSIFGDILGVNPSIVESGSFRSLDDLKAA